MVQDEDHKKMKYVLQYLNIFISEWVQQNKLDASQWDIENLSLNIMGSSETICLVAVSGMLSSEKWSLKILRFKPTRSWQKNTGPGELFLITTAMIANNGLNIR